MTITESERHELYEGVKAAFGKRPTETLMKSMAPTNWDDVATRADIALF